MAKRQARRSQRPSQNSVARETDMRVVGGFLRGSKLTYAGDPRVRPMKERVREAVFNLLGPAVADTFVIDLFGGTGALALEAISRGARAALIIEQHHPTARVIQDNIAALQLAENVQLLRGNAFHWLHTQPDLPPERWAVFCCPPYRFFQERQGEMLDLIGGLFLRAPLGSLFLVETTDTFDITLLPAHETWTVRRYPPATIALTTISEGSRESCPTG